MYKHYTQYLKTLREDDLNKLYECKNADALASMNDCRLILEEIRERIKKLDLGGK